MNQSTIHNHNQTKKSTLVNFISPNQILETFDQICSFQSTTRTSTLIKLMKEFISDQSATIPHQIQSLQNLKNDLSKFEIIKSEGMDQKIRPNRKLGTPDRFKDRSYPIPFFIDKDME